MDNAFAKSVDDVLAAFSVDTAEGLEDEQVRELRAQHGKNGMPFCDTSGPPFAGSWANPCALVIPDDPPTPLWELILEQFKDQLVLILLGSAAVSFVLALFEEEGGWTAFVDPAVVRLRDAPPCASPQLTMCPCRFLPS